METVRKLVCIVCPRGCAIDVTMDGGEIKSVRGFTCKRGEAYARTECTAPTRTLTTTVRISGARLPMIPVKTKTPVPKGKIFECMDAIKDVSVSAPVHVGDVLLRDVCGTGSDIVASRTMAKTVR